MANKQRIQSAFQKIKQDIINLSNSVNFLDQKLKSQETTLSLNKEIKEELSELKQFNLEAFVEKMEKELNSLNHFIQGFAKTSQEYAVNMKNLHKKIEDYDDKAKKISKTIEQKTSQQFQKIIEDKVSQEISTLRLELQNEILKQSGKAKSK